MRVVYRPYPVVGLITPWNGPIGNPMLDIVGALLAGATVLTKPSEVTPLSWLEVVRGWNDDIGAPPVLGVVTGGGETGAAVVDEVDMVMFTGSNRTGARIAARCGERLIPCSLELGGKDAMIVLADADLERASSRRGLGRRCSTPARPASPSSASTSRRRVYDEFVAKVTAKVGARPRRHGRPRRVRRPRSARSPRRTSWGSSSPTSRTRSPRAPG